MLSYYSDLSTKIDANYEEVVVAVNKSLSKFCDEMQFKDYLMLYKLNTILYKKQDDKKDVLQLSNPLCELSAGPNGKSPISTLNSITRKTYPHHFIIKKFIDFLLNEHSVSDFEFLEEVFNKLLYSHPPCQENFDYYFSILFNCYSTVDYTFQDKSLFVCVAESVIHCLRNPKNSVSEANNNDSLVLLSGLKHYNENIANCSSQKESVKSVKSLCWIDQMKIYVKVFKFVYDILESNFAFWLACKEPKLYYYSAENRPLISHVLWPDKRDSGLINKEFSRLMEMYVLSQKLPKELLNNLFLFVDLVKKFFRLAAEMVRFCDKKEEIKYPYLGTKSNDLARKFSRKLYEVLQNRECEKEVTDVANLIQNLKPAWLKLLLCSYLLNYICGYQWPPELIAPNDILEYFANSKCVNTNKETSQPKKIEVSAKASIVKKFKKLKSVNTKRSKGKTLLHLACENNNVCEVKALLTFPDLEINATDNQGWTALHVAAFRGHIDCVRELLSLKKSGNLVCPNTRAKELQNQTPLMYAVSQGHADVCTALLEHTGSVLLEDINDSNETCLDLCKSEEIKRILKHYQSNIVRTEFSQINIHVEDKLKVLVIRLCIEMIQSYFCTHRTWDVYRALKSSTLTENQLKYSHIDQEWDYKRYIRDIERNIPRLRKLSNILVQIPEFEPYYYFFKKNLLVNKWVK